VIKNDENIFSGTFPSDWLGFSTFQFLILIFSPFLERKRREPFWGFWFYQIPNKSLLLEKMQTPSTPFYFQLGGGHQWNQRNRPGRLQINSQAIELISIRGQYRGGAYRDQVGQRKAVTSLALCKPWPKSSGGGATVEIWALPYVALNRLEWRQFRIKQKAFNYKFVSLEFSLELLISSLRTLFAIYTESYFRIPKAINFKFQF